MERIAKSVSSRNLSNVVEDEVVEALSETIIIQKLLIVIIK